MNPLSGSQVEKVKEIFERWDSDGNGRLDREQLIKVFREVFHPELSIEEVEGVSGAWGVDFLERMDFLDFLCVFSRFLRIHEQDWNLLSGFYEVMGKRQIAEADVIRSKELARTQKGLSQAHAEEMLWAVDWRRDGDGEGKTLSFIDFIAAVLMNVDLNPGELPPSPAKQVVDAEVMSFNAEKPSLDVTHRNWNLLKRTQGSNDKSMRKIVPDMQFSEDPTLSQVEGMVQDLRDHKPYAAAKQDDADAPQEEGSILDMMLKKREELDFQAKQTTIVHMETRLELDKQTQFELIGCRAKIYGMCEMPASSMAAQYLSFFMGAMIIISVCLLFLEPLISPPTKTKTDSEEKVWKGIDATFTVIFTSEYIIRLLVCNSIGNNTIADFVKTPSNICDFVALLPFYVELILSSTKDGLRLLRTARLMKLIRLLRVSRVMRLTKLAKHGTHFATLAGPVSMVFTVIWGIYLLSLDD